MVYHPPGLPAQDHRSLNEYVINTIDFLRNKYPDYGVVVLGDFNDFDISQLLSTRNLKQVVQLPTRGSAILDLILYMKKFLDCDWLRGMQFFGNTVQKKGN